MDRVILGWIRAIHWRSFGTYGAPRVHAELQHGQDVHVGRKRVERLMRADGLSGVHQRRRRNLTKQDPMATPAPDLIGRDFDATTSPIPGARMVGDITYLATGEGWLYLADALDLATRSVLGYAMARPRAGQPGG
jgi:transposase InsO family protein